MIMKAPETIRHTIYDVIAAGGEDFDPLPCELPTNERKGSWERVLVYRERVAAGEDIWHPRDENGRT